MHNDLFWPKTQYLSYSFDALNDEFSYMSYTSKFNYQYVIIYRALQSVAPDLGLATKLPYSHLLG